MQNRSYDDLAAEIQGLEYLIATEFQHSVREAMINRLCRLQGALYSQPQPALELVDDGFYYADDYREPVELAA